MHPGNSPERLSGQVPMTYGRPLLSNVRCGPGGNTKSTERDAMNMIKSQTFRVVMLLSALASSSLVLMAGRRWF